jgi:hypothetical protein
MKRLAAICFLIIFLHDSCKKPGCFEDAGPEVIVQRNTGSFHRIDLFDDVDVVLTQDTIESIKVVAAKNIEPNIYIQNENGTLIIKNNTTCKWLRSPAEKPKAYVNVKMLDYINYSGSGNITSSNTIIANTISFYSATGAGNIDISLEAKLVNATVEYESADFIFHGKADVCYCYANSRGTLGFKDFEVKRLIIGYAGNRDVTVNATEIIEATIYHAGNIYYKGSPSNISTTFYSSGRLYHLP